MLDSEMETWRQRELSRNGWTTKYIDMLFRIYVKWIEQGKDAIPGQLKDALYVYLRTEPIPVDFLCKARKIVKYERDRI